MDEVGFGAIVLLPGSVASTSVKDGLLAEAVSQPIAQPARVSGAIVPAIADEDRGHRPRGA